MADIEDKIRQLGEYMEKRTAPMKSGTWRLETTHEGTMAVKRDAGGNARSCTRKMPRKLA